MTSDRVKPNHGDTSPDTTRCIHVRIFQADYKRNALTFHIKKRICLLNQL